MTQADLAEKCGVSRALIAMIEAGHIRPYPRIRRKIAEALGGHGEFVDREADILPALERALESGEPCMTILQQIASIRGAANGLMGEMVEIHLQDELVSGETTPDQRAARMAEVGHLLRSYLK